MFLQPAGVSYVMRALIGQSPCLDHAIQARKFSLVIFLCGYFKKDLPHGALEELGANALKQSQPNSDILRKSYIVFFLPIGSKRNPKRFDWLQERANILARTNGQASLSISRETFPDSRASTHAWMIWREIVTLDHL